MIISHNTDKYMNMIKNVFFVKPESIATPRMYLGMNCKKINDENWVLGSSHYLKEFLKVANRIVENLNMKANQRGNPPFSNLQYRPELDSTDFCNESQIRPI